MKLRVKPFYTVVRQQAKRIPFFLYLRLCVTQNLSTILAGTVQKAAQTKLWVSAVDWPLETRVGFVLDT